MCRFNCKLMRLHKRENLEPIFTPAQEQQKFQHEASEKEKAFKLRVRFHFILMRLNCATFADGKFS